MEFSSNVLKHYLKNVYFISGTGCGGKSTMSKIISEKYGFILYNQHQVAKKHNGIANSQNQPAMTKKFLNWGEYYNRQPIEYQEWLSSFSNEELEMILLDLIFLSQNKKVIVDIHISPKTVLTFTDYNRIAFLLAPPELVVNDYFKREDHRKTYDRIQKLKNPEKTFENMNNMLVYATEKTIREVSDSSLFYLIRNQNSTIQNTLVKLERHFGLIK